MTKRKADFEVNEDQNNEFKIVEKQDVGGKINTQEEIAQRRILKIKGPKLVGDKKTNSEVKFQLTQDLDATPDKSPVKELPAPSFLNNAIPSDTAQHSVFSDKSLSGNINPSLLSLFNNNHPSTPKVANTADTDNNNNNNNDNSNNGLGHNHNHQQQNNNQHLQNEKNEGQQTPSEKKTEEQPKSEENKKNEEEKKPEPVSLFGNIKLQPGGLFASLRMPLGGENNSIGEKKDTTAFPTSSNLFASLGNTSSFFGSSLGTGGLFSTGSTLNQGLLDSTPKLGLFTSTPGMMSFGNFSSANPLNFPINNAQGGEEDEDGEDNEKEDSPEVDPGKSSGQYTYESFTEKIFSKPITKFKVNNQDPFETGFLSLERATQSNINYLIYRNSVKLILYKGMILRKASKLAPLNKKNDCVLVVTFGEKKSGDDEGSDKKPKENENGQDNKDTAKLTSKVSIDNCKLMFQNEDDCKAFKEKFNELI